MDSSALLVQVLTWPVAAILAWRAARGSLSLVAWLVAVLLAAYAASTLTDAGSEAERILVAVANVSLVVLFALFPDGRPTPPWIAIPVLIAVAIQAANVASGFVLESQPLWPWHLLAVWIVTLIGGQWYRYRRRSSVAEREQTRWPLLAMAGMVFVFTLTQIVFIGLDLPTGAGAGLATVLLSLPGLGFAAGLLAPPRVHVDVALRWLVLIGGASVTVAFTILATGLAVQALGASPPAREWLAATAAAGLVLPIAVLWGRISDRVVFGRRATPLQTLEYLGERLATIADPRQVPGTIVQTLTETLGVGGARLFVGDAVLAQVGRHHREETFAISHQGAKLATLAVSPRPGDVTLTGLDRTIIARVADHAGASLRGASLFNDLVEARTSLVAAREDERRRLRRDLHDDLAPTLAGLGIKAAIVEQLSQRGDTGAADAARSLANQLQMASRQVRDIAYGLRPPILDDRGLVAAVEETIAAGLDAPDVRVSAPPGRLDVGPAIEACALRIIQEAVLNVRRHAAASSCEIRISADSSDLVIEVIDDGVGVADRLRTGVGIRSMMERAAEVGGTVSISSRSGIGTRVFARLPASR